MRTFNLIHLLLAGGFILLDSVHLHAQSGWTKKKGELFSKLSYNHFQSKSYYTLSGNEITTNEFRQQAIGVYAEYGITDKITLITDWPLIKNHGFETTEKITGTGDLRLGVKYAIYQKIPISFSLIPEIPIAKADNFAQNKQNDFERINLPTGDGEFNVYGILAASHSFYPTPIYLNLYAAYNLRTSYDGISLRDQLIEGFEVGWQPFSKSWIRTGLKMQHVLAGPNGTVSFVRGEGTEYSSVFFGAFYNIFGNWGIDLSFITYLNTPQKRRNLYSSPTLSVGIVYEIKK